MLFASVATFAEGENTKEVNAYDMTANMEQLGKALHLKKSQTVPVSSVYEDFCESMSKAGAAADSDKGAIIRLAVESNFNKMKTVMNKKQYNKYVLLINVTLEHRGLSDYLLK